jgi:CRP-like cAMP-binding protein
MTALFEILRGHPKRHFGANETIIAEESTTGMLFFLIDGEVEVYKDDVQLATTSEPGSVFGEMSALLGSVPGNPSRRKHARFGGARAPP